MIVFCHLLNDASGSPQVLKSTIEALSGAEGENILFIGSQGRGVLESANIVKRRFWYRRSRHRLVTLVTYLISQVALYRALAKAKDIPQDAIVFVNTLLPFAAMLWGRRTGRRVVVHVHEASISPRLLRFFLTNCAAVSADLLLYVSNDHKARLPIVGPPSFVVTNPVSSTLLSRADETIPRQHGQFRVLMLASLRSYKGIEEFMALAKGLQNRTDISFDLVLNAEVHEVVAFAKNHSDVANVTIHPRTDDQAHFYHRADLLLNLSRVDKFIETFGLTLAEAMTFGLPVIAPPIGGPAEIVTHGSDGYCVDSRDGAALRAAVLKLLDDLETYGAMARAARARAGDFTFDTYALALRNRINSLGKWQPK